MRKRMFFLVPVLVLALLLCACNGTVTEDDTTYKAENESSEPETTAVDLTTIPTTEERESTTVPETTTSPVTRKPETTTARVTTTSQQPEEPETVPPRHSPLYLAGYSTDQIIEYFEEVVLHMEYVDDDDDGSASLVQKWTIPIYYRIYGNPTEEDLEVLADLFVQLNEIDGFPGIYAAPDGEPENLKISFLDHETFYNEFSESVHGEDAYGAVQFWYYTDTNDIYKARIGYRTDLDQVTRNSVLVEEIVNLLGLSDTVLREDSVVYQYSNENIELSDVDLLIIKLLYNPAIQCGSDYYDCQKVIRDLYY